MLEIPSNPGILSSQYAAEGLEIESHTADVKKKAGPPVPGTDYYQNQSMLFSTTQPGQALTQHHYNNTRNIYSTHTNAIFIFTISRDSSVLVHFSTYSLVTHSNMCSQ